MWLADLYAYCYNYEHSDTKVKKVSSQCSNVGSYLADVVGTVSTPAHQSHQILVRKSWAISELMMMSEPMKWLGSQVNQTATESKNCPAYGD